MTVYQQESQVETSMSEAFENYLPNMPLNKTSENESFRKKSTVIGQNSLKIKGSKVFVNSKIEQKYYNLAKQDQPNLNEIESQKILSWTDGPVLKIRILISDLTKINFKLSIWKVLGTEQTPEYLERGVAYFFIDKLINQSSKTTNDGVLFHKFQTQTKELFLSGRKEGEITVQLEASHSFYLAQKVAGV